MKRNWKIAVMVLLVAGSGVGCQPAGGMTRTGTDIGAADSRTVFPDFSVKNLEGQEVSLSRYRGKIVILDMFATWCPPCRMTVPVLVDLQKSYPGKLVVVGLSYDQAAASTVRRFIRDMGINYDVFWGSQEIASYVGLRGIPHAVILDPRGRIAGSYIGYQPKSVYEHEIKALLGSGDERE